MEVIAVEHPLIAHKLTKLRDVHTDSPTFRRLTDELVTLLSYEATRDIRVEQTEVETPITRMNGVALTQPYPLIVPILRAGLGMLEGVTRLMPNAEVGFVGMARNEDTLEPVTYAERLPRDLTGRQCIVLDPMLATGGSLGGTINFLAQRGASTITAICLLAAPEGIEKVQALTQELDVQTRLVVSAIDEKLNEKGYIVPGLGDAGDRLYGLAE